MTSRNQLARVMFDLESTNRSILSTCVIVFQTHLLLPTAICYTNVMEYFHKKKTVNTAWRNNFFNECLLIVLILMYFIQCRQINSFQLLYFFFKLLDIKTKIIEKKIIISVINKTKDQNETFALGWESNPRLWYSVSPSILGLIVENKENHIVPETFTRQYMLGSLSV